MTSVTKWTRWAILLVMTFSTSCTTLTGSSDSVPTFVAPDLPTYSERFEQIAASELVNLDRACDRQDPVPPCSALHRWVRDYFEVRQKVRKGKAVQ